MNAPTSPNLLLIFTRNPILGQCKTRLAKTIGDRAALEIYQLLLKKTREASRGAHADKWVCYSDYIGRDDGWDQPDFAKQQQRGRDLGERMHNAFEQGFAAGYRRICIIGSDLWDLDSTLLNLAFGCLEQSEAVIGPALDGGYYLLGLSRLMPELFTGKAWGGPAIYQETIRHFSSMAYTVLPAKNDIDIYEDIKDIEAFRPLINIQNR